MARTIIDIQNGVTRHPAHRMAEPVSLSIMESEQVAIVGENGAGKSRLVDIVTRRFPLLQDEVRYDFGPDAHPLVSDNLKYIAFRDCYGEQDGMRYYQQRWNQHDIEDNAPTVGDALKGASEELMKMFSLDILREKPVVTLSSGETRKLQLTRALTGKPRMLILDNPFIGLDAPTRDMLGRLLGELTEQTPLQFILVLSKTDDIPAFVTHVLPVEGLRVGKKVTREQYFSQRPPLPSSVLPAATRQWIARLEQKDMAAMPFYPQLGGEILKFQDVTIRYGSRTILSHLNWTVREGEHWALGGENGAGKSTLLSLVCADNPQAYACRIELFGHRRGTGESIWEIKRHIGYVSPEMHRTYQKDIPATDIVASGFCDSVGLYIQPRPEQRNLCRDWMRAFGIDTLADRTFLSLSSGEQRLCLLARAFVKDPELLILDEPLHGLDDRNRQRVKEIIEVFCQRKNKTLVMVTHYEEELPPCISHKLYLKRNH